MHSQMVAVVPAIRVTPGHIAPLLHPAMLQLIVRAMEAPRTRTRQTVVRANVQVGSLGQTVLFHHPAPLKKIAMEMETQPMLIRLMDVIACATKVTQAMIATHLLRARLASTVRVTAAPRIWTAQTAAHANAKQAGVDLPARFLHRAGTLLSATGMARPQMETD